MGIWSIPCGCSVISAAWTYVSTASVCELSTRHCLRLSWTGWQLAVQILQTNAGFSSEISHFQQPLLTFAEDNSAVPKPKHELMSMKITPEVDTFVHCWSHLSSCPWDKVRWIKSNLSSLCQLWHLLNQGLELMVQWKVFTVQHKLPINLAHYRTLEIKWFILSPRIEMK